MSMHFWQLVSCHQYLCDDVYCCHLLWRAISQQRHVYCSHLAIRLHFQLIRPCIELTETGRQPLIMTEIGGGHETMWLAPDKIWIWILRSATILAKTPWDALALSITIVREKPERNQILIREEAIVFTVWPGEGSAILAFLIPKSAYKMTTTTFKIDISPGSVCINKQNLHMGIIGKLWTTSELWRWVHLQILQPGNYLTICQKWWCTPGQKYLWKIPE